METYVLSSFPWLSMVYLVHISQLQADLPFFFYTDTYLMSPGSYF